VLSRDLLFSQDTREVHYDVSIINEQIGICKSFEKSCRFLERLLKHVKIKYLNVKHFSTAFEILPV